MGNNLIPNPFDSDKEFNRFYHYDLPDMEVEDLLCELCATRYRLWLLSRSSRLLSLYEQRQRIRWYQERIHRIEAELRNRRYVAWHGRSQPKPKLAEGVRL
jgi:hypothetical protein